MPDAPRRAGFSLEDAVLDIGGDVGALILYTDAEYDQREIEISPIEPVDHDHDHEHEREHEREREHAAGHGHPAKHGHPAEHAAGHGHLVHTAIHERRAGGQTTYAGIYPELKAGRYRLLIDDPTLPTEVTIVGGEVAELDWRTGIVDPSPD